MTFCPTHTGTIVCRFREAFLMHLSVTMSVYRDNLAKTERKHTEKLQQLVHRTKKVWFWIPFSV